MHRVSSGAALSLISRKDRVVGGVGVVELNTWMGLIRWGACPLQKIGPYVVSLAS